MLRALNPKYTDMLDNVYAKKADVVTREMAEETILVPLTDHVADMDTLMKLNDTGTFIWKHLDGKRSLRDIVAIITDNYDVEQKEVEEAVQDFIKQMDGFVERRPE